MRDPEFGYHWVWLYPVFIIFIILMLFVELYDETKEFYRKFRMRRMLKKNPDIKDLTKLAGIK